MYRAVQRTWCNMSYHAHTQNIFMMLMLHCFVLINLSNLSGLKENVHVINDMRVVCSTYSCTHTHIRVIEIKRRTKPMEYIRLYWIQ